MVQNTCTQKICKKKICQKLPTTKTHAFSEKRQNTECNYRFRVIKVYELPDFDALSLRSSSWLESKREIQITTYKCSEHTSDWKYTTYIWLDVKRGGERNISRANIYNQSTKVNKDGFWDQACFITAWGKASGSFLTHSNSLDLSENIHHPYSACEGLSPVALHLRETLKYVALL